MAADATYELAAELFEKALRLPEEKRDRFICDMCVGRPALAEELASLLAAHEEVENSFLGQTRLPATSPGAQAWVGRRLGGYEILEVLAQGGMGVVYRARQDSPRREVALKVIRGGVVSDQVLRRFMLEAEVLGRMAHPGIAHIYEAATAETEHGGQPYFAMELIQGPTLHRYFKEQNPDQNQCIDLMIDIAEAVHHAHVRGVIHRDIKPGNIIIDPSGKPKVLDFGVARLMGADVNATMETNAGQVLGTLSYMSPEQVRGRHDEIDFRSDVYSLGVLGYELISTRLPHEVREVGLAEAARQIEDEPPPPMTTPERRVPDDLETIIGKCLRKDPEDRYATAADLASELRRFRAGEPIEASPVRRTSQAREFVEQHWVPLAAGGSAVALTLAALGVSVNGWVQTTNELDRIRSQVLSRPDDPSREGLDSSVTEWYRTLADEARATLGPDEGGDQVVQFVTDLSRLLQDLGRLDAAETVLLEAHRDMETRYGLEDDRAHRVAARLAELYSQTGRPDMAEQLQTAVPAP